MPAISTLDEKELYFVTALANPKVLCAVRGHLDHLIWISPLAKRISEYFIGLPDGQAYNKLVLHSHLVHEFIESEITQILGRCLEQRRLYEKDAQGLQTNQILQQFQRFYNRKSTTKLIQDFQHDPEKLVDEIEKLSKIKFSMLPLDTLGELDVDQIIKEDLGNVTYVPSRFDFIQEAFQPHPGYPTGRLVQVCARTGAGKSNFLAHEVVAVMEANKKLKEEDRFRVYWLALGDMSRIDFVVRMTAIALNKPFHEVHENPKKYFTEEMRDLFKYVKITTVPPATIDVHGAKYFVENSVVHPDFDPEIIILDYDTNFKTNRESMYLESEDIYNTAVSIARPINNHGRLVFIVSQPKIEYWHHCPLPLEAAAESSRKQAIIDLMITIAQDPSCAPGHRVGKMFVAKNRHGEEGGIGLYRLKDGLFYQIGPEEYAVSLEASSSGNRGGGNSSGGGGRGGRRGNGSYYDRY